MVLAGVIEQYIIKFCGRWLKNFTKENIKVGVVSGTITMTGVEVNTEEIDEFLSPFTPKFIYMGHLFVDVPLRPSRPLVVEVADLYLLLAATDLRRVPPEAISRALQAQVYMQFIQKKVQEALRRQAAPGGGGGGPNNAAASSSQGNGQGDFRLPQLLQNLRVSVRHVHIRVEEAAPGPGPGPPTGFFALGAVTREVQIAPASMEQELLAAGGGGGGAPSSATAASAAEGDAPKPSPWARLFGRKKAPPPPPSEEDDGSDASGHGGGGGSSSSRAAAAAAALRLLDKVCLLKEVDVYWANDNMYQEMPAELAVGLMRTGVSVTASVTPLLFQTSLLKVKLRMELGDRAGRVRRAGLSVQLGEVQADVGGAQAAFAVRWAEHLLGYRTAMQMLCLGHATVVEEGGGAAAAADGGGSGAPVASVAARTCRARWRRAIGLVRRQERQRRRTPAAARGGSREDAAAARWRGYFREWVVARRYVALRELLAREVATPTFRDSLGGRHARLYEAPRAQVRAGFAYAQRHQLPPGDVAVAENLLRGYLAQTAGGAAAPRPYCPSPAPPRGPGGSRSPSRSRRGSGGGGAGAAGGPHRPAPKGPSPSSPAPGNPGLGALRYALGPAVTRALYALQLELDGTERLGLCAGARALADERGRLRARLADRSRPDQGLLLVRVLTADGIQQATSWSDTAAVCEAALGFPEGSAAAAAADLDPALALQPGGAAKATRPALYTRAERRCTWNQTLAFRTPAPAPGEPPDFELALDVKTRVLMVDSSYGRGRLGAGPLAGNPRDLRTHEVPLRPPPQLSLGAAPPAPVLHLVTCYFPPGSDAAETELLEQALGSMGAMDHHGRTAPPAAEEGEPPVAVGHRGLDLLVRCLEELSTSVRVDLARVRLNAEDAYYAAGGGGGGGGSGGGGEPGFSPLLECRLEGFRATATWRVRAGAGEARAGADRLAVVDHQAPPRGAAAAAGGRPPPPPARRRRHPLPPPGRRPSHAPDNGGGGPPLPATGSGEGLPAGGGRLEDEDDITTYTRPPMLDLGPAEAVVRATSGRGWEALCLENPMLSKLIIAFADSLVWDLSIGSGAYTIQFIDVDPQENSPKTDEEVTSIWKLKDNLQWDLESLKNMRFNFFQHLTSITCLRRNKCWPDGTQENYYTLGSLFRGFQLAVKYQPKGYKGQVKELDWSANDSQNVIQPDEPSIFDALEDDEEEDSSELWDALPPDQRSELAKEQIRRLEAQIKELRTYVL